MNNREILLLTGLGDDKIVERQLRFISWLNKQRPEDAQIRAFPTLWQTAETYADKWSSLLAYVSEHAGIRVVYGVSAGASLAMSLVPKLPSDTEYHFVSGKLLYPESIGADRNNRAPALRESVTASERVISATDLSQFNLTCHAGFLDGVLDQRDMRIPDVPFHRIPMINHSATIVMAYPTILREL